MTTCVCNFHPSGSGFTLCHGFIKLVKDNKTVKGPIPIKEIISYKFEGKYDYFYYKVGDKVNYMFFENESKNIDKSRIEVLKHIKHYNPDLKLAE